MNKRGEDCFYFLNSRCNKGDLCSFRHNPLCINENTDTCSDWLLDQCTNDSCPLRHPAKDDRRSTTYCRFELQPGGCRYGDDCAYMHQYLVPPEVPIGSDMNGGWEADEEDGWTGPGLAENHASNSSLVIQIGGDTSSEEEEGEGEESDSETKEAVKLLAETNETRAVKAISAVGIDNQYHYSRYMEYPSQCNAPYPPPQLNPSPAPNFNQFARGSGPIRSHNPHGHWPPRHHPRTNHHRDNGFTPWPDMTPQPPPHIWQGEGPDEFPPQHDHGTANYHRDWDWQGYGEDQWVHRPEFMPPNMTNHHSPSHPQWAPYNGKDYPSHHNRHSHDNHHPHSSNGGPRSKYPPYQYQHSTNPRGRLTGRIGGRDGHRAEESNESHPPCDLPPMDLSHREAYLDQGLANRPGSNKMSPNLATLKIKSLAEILLEKQGQSTSPLGSDDIRRRQWTEQEDRERGTKRSRQYNGPHSIGH